MGYGRKDKLTQPVAVVELPVLAIAKPAPSIKSLHYSLLSQATQAYISRLSQPTSSGLRASIAALSNEQARQSVQRLIEQAQQTAQAEEDDDEEALMLMY